MRKRRSLPPVPETCTVCGRPIAPDAPAVHTATVDIVGGRAVSTAPLHYHLQGGCWEAAKREARASGGPAAA